MARFWPKTIPPAGVVLWLVGLTACGPGAGDTYIPQRSAVRLHGNV